MGVEADALERLIGFGRELRHRGLNVGTGRIVTFCRSAAALGTLDRTGLYWAGRSSLISRPEDAEAFDAAFDDWFREGTQIEVDLGTHVPGAGIERDLKELQGLTEEERLRVARVIRRLAVAVPRRRTRRFRPAQGGARFDVRRTLRRSLRTHGEPFHRSWRDRGVRTRPLVLILDVSGSMSPYARALLQFAFAAMAAGRRVEVFCFGTRLTRVTRTLKTKDPDRAMHEIGRQVADWEGGTRIGASLKTLLDEWGQRAALRGSVAVICSDGLERGEPELLRDQMARLRRLA